MASLVNGRRKGDYMLFVREGEVRALLLLLMVSFASGEALAEEATETPSAPSEGVDGHLETLRSLDPAERIEAIRALGAARSQEAVGPLARVLREDPSPEVRGWAVRSLSEIGTTEARAALAIAAQHDSDQRVRTLANQMSGSVAASPFGPSPSAVVQPSPMVQPSPLVQQPQRAAYNPMMQGPLRGPFQARRRRPGLGLTIAGWSVFGGTYLISMIAGAATLADGAENTWSLFLPIIGPIVEASFLFANYGGEVIAPVAILLFLDALAQIAGVAMGTVGLVRRHRARQPAEGDGVVAEGDEALPEGEGDENQPGGDVDEAEEHQGASSRRTWGLAIVPTTGGLAFTGWF